MVARCRDAHKGALVTVTVAGCCYVYLDSHAILRGGVRTSIDGSCYNNRSMYHELDNLRCPHPGADA